MAQTHGGPGERRLDRPPSERYGTRSEPTAAAAGGDRGSPVRGLALGVLASVGGTAGFIVLASLVLVTAGLLVWAGITGWLTALAVRQGARDTLDRGARVGLVVGLALVAVGLGQVGIWIVSRAEGGALSLVDYLATVFGFLVPLEFLVAALVGWRTAR